jgi:hypothetical protein
MAEVYGVMGKQHEVHLLPPCPLETCRNWHEGHGPFVQDTLRRLKPLTENHDYDCRCTYCHMRRKGEQYHITIGPVPELVA